MCTSREFALLFTKQMCVTIPQDMRHKPLSCKLFQLNRVCVNWPIHYMPDNTQFYLLINLTCTVAFKTFIYHNCTTVFQVKVKNNFRYFDYFLNIPVVGYWSKNLKNDINIFLLITKNYCFILF
jgi:hypothetical protein